MKLDYKLISMMLVTYLVWITYSLPMTFFPLKAKSKGVSETFIGYILANFALGTILSSLLFGKIMGKVGKNRLLYICLLFCMIGSIGFGMIDYINNVYWYIIIGSISRFICGFMAGGVCTIIFSYLPILYPDNYP